MNVVLTYLEHIKASVKDIDVAVAAAREAFKTTWGKNITGFERAKLLNKLADLIERDAQELAELESLNNGKPVAIARSLLYNQQTPTHNLSDLMKQRF